MEEKKKKITLRIFEAVENFGLLILEKIHLKGLADFYRKHIEGMRYLICGALATAVNIGVYSLFYYPFHVNNGTSNVIAWIVAAIFAYITNRIIVFDSQVNSKKGLAREIISFFGCRLLTLAVDQAIMIFTVDKLGWNGFLMKVLANIIVIILNFIFSKVLIFKKDENQKESEGVKEKNFFKGNWHYIAISTIYLIINILLVSVTVKGDSYTLQLPTNGLLGLINWIVTIVLGIYGILIIKIAINKKLPLEKIYLMIVIPIGICYCLANPLGRIPDEDQHVRRAMALAQGDFFPQGAEDKTVNGMFNVKLGRLVSGSSYTYDEAWRRIMIEETDKEGLAGYTNQALYSPICHSPQALGIFIAKILGGNLVVQCYAARIFNFGIAVFLIYEAIKLLPFKKNVLMFIAMLPISMNELASMSADALTIASALFYISYILYLRYDKNKEKINKKDIVILSISSIVVAMCKIVYLPLCMLLFIIPKEKYSSKKKKNVITCVIFAASIILNLLWILYATRFFVSFAPGVNGPEQLKFILTNPVRYLLILFRTISLNSQRFILGLCGEGLSMVTANASQLYVISTIMILSVLFVCNDDDELDVELYIKVLSLIIFVGIVFLIYTSLYIQWTPLIDSVIDGVQARYFLPILFLTAIAMKNKEFKFNSKKYLCYILLYILFFNINGITSIVSSHF